MVTVRRGPKKACYRSARDVRASCIALARRVSLTVDPIDRSVGPAPLPDTGGRRRRKGEEAPRGRRGPGRSKGGTVGSKSARRTATFLVAALFVMGACGDSGGSAKGTASTTN